MCLYISYVSEVGKVAVDHVDAVIEPSHFEKESNGKLSRKVIGKTNLLSSEIVIFIRIFVKLMLITQYSRVDQESENIQRG